MSTRAERRRERELDAEQFLIEAFPAKIYLERPELKPPLLRSPRFWVPIGILVVLLTILIVGAVVGKHVYDRAMAAKSSLEQAMPLASKVADQILAGDSEAARATATKVAQLTADAREQTDDDVWKSVEWIPVAGSNLHAVRTAAAVTDDLVRDALVPATAMSLDALKPADGAIDISAITEMQQIVEQASDAVSEASTTLNGIDREPLIPQVDDALSQLTGAVDELQPMLQPASEILGVLPAALGAEKPRHYLMVFQNNAESRGTGGNPAALVMIDVDNGKIEIGQQAASGDFRNARTEPVTKLNPQTEAVYGDKIGRWISDATMSPDFPESAQILRAWWAEEFGTPIDAVISFDPVALSYLLKATGPAVVPDDPIEVEGVGPVRFLDEPITLTHKNAVPFLLNEVYWKYEPAVQDAIFAASARAVLDVVTSGKAEPKALIESLTRAVDEGRLMYQPATKEEAELVGHSKLSGKLPTSNENTTVLGAYVNDFTQSKLDYYMQLDIAAATTQCTKPDKPTFTLTASLTNTLKPEQAANLPRSIAPARYFEKGRVATNLVVYGPVGSTSAEVTLNGQTHRVQAKPHLGRPAVLVKTYNRPGEKRTVTVKFAGAEGEYGPLEVRHTPMVRSTPVEIKSPGCE